MVTISVFKRSPFFIRLFNWEYWSFNVVYAPVAGYYLWLAVKARSLFFFSASNPSIETGGMFGESKWKIFEILPPGTYPATILINENETFELVLQKLSAHNLNYPLIAKPDRGERGWLVAKINNEAELKQYHSKVKIDFLLQQFVDWPVELSIFYYRLPHWPKGVISSMVEKELLAVTGNGKHTLLQLIQNYPRALLQLPVLQKQYAGIINTVLPAGQKMVLVEYGNHSRGAMFVDACHKIDDQLTATIDTLSQQIPGFYFGRYDLRCQSIEALKQGHNFKILELNGAGAEPAHIYNPGFSLITAYRVLFHHFNMLYKISKANNLAGVPYMSGSEYLNMRRLVATYKQKGNSI